MKVVMREDAVTTRNGVVEALIKGCVMDVSIEVYHDLVDILQIADPADSMIDEETMGDEPREDIEGI